MIGLIRFLPLDTAHPVAGGLFLRRRADLGLLWRVIGFAVQPAQRAGLFERQPARTDGGHAGGGLAAGSAGAALMVAFYAVYHVLVKGGLFLASDALTNGTAVCGG